MWFWLKSRYTDSFFLGGGGSRICDQSCHTIFLETEHCCSQFGIVVLDYRWTHLTELIEKFGRTNFFLLFCLAIFVFRNEHLLPKIIVIFTTLLLGRSRASFWDVFFSILVALSLGAVLRLSNITPGEIEARVIGRNRRRNRYNKKNL